MLAEEFHQEIVMMPIENPTAMIIELMLARLLKSHANSKRSLLAEPYTYRTIEADGRDKTHNATRFTMVKLSPEEAAQLCDVGDEHLDTHRVFIFEPDLSNDFRVVYCPPGAKPEAPRRRDADDHTGIPPLEWKHVQATRISWYGHYSFFHPNGAVMDISRYLTTGAVPVNCNQLHEPIVAP